MESGPAPAGAPRRWRDPRLDFFRGLAMIIIVISHVPWNPWANWIPARFGFSDAAEIFVFCSGIASALAFGGLFARRGWIAGTAAMANRIWQVYWVHIGTFLVIAATMALLAASPSLERNYVAELNLQHFFNAPDRNLVGLLTLTYVPNYFDILPMYLVILAMVPVFVALAAVHKGLAALFCAVLYLAANVGSLNLPAEPWSERQWFFNPFGWQIVFFVGFAFGAGWVRPPPVTRRLLTIAGAIVLLSVPFSIYDVMAAIGLGPVFEALTPLMSKSSLAPFRVLHFFALAYLAWVAVGPRGERLSQGTHWPMAAGVLRRVGQQSLAVFAAGMLLSRLMGVGLDILGRGSPAVAVVNLTGIAAAIGVAYAVSWLKQSRAGATKQKTTVPAEAAPEGGQFVLARPAGQAFLRSRR